MGQISIWSTPWCESWAQIYDNLIIQPETYSYPSQVKDLWIPGQKIWNSQLIDTLFQEQMAEEIKNTPIITTHDEDCLCWKLTLAGKCSTKSAYKACLERLFEQGEPTPRQVSTSTKQLLQTIWKNSNIIPRIKTFGWRIIRQAISSGARAGKYSKHISKLCCRCHLEETDQHLFFLCAFARAAWFMNPWHLRVDQFASPSDSISQILTRLLNMNHPNGTIENILIFMWCLWKSRNDCLFNKKDSTPLQIYQRTNAIKKNLELLDVVQVSGNKIQARLNTQGNQTRQGNTIRSDLQIQGSKIFTDAAWKRRKAQDTQENCKTGIGVYCQFPGQGREETVMIQASTTYSSSPLLAEAAALLFATKVAAQVQAQGATFLTDNLTLARAASATALTSDQVPWELRQQIADYKRVSEELQSKIFHINRNLNGVAHDCAQQAIRRPMSLPIFTCLNSAHRCIGSCPFALSFQNFEFQGYVLLDVLCL
jgi:hypothetical protein